MKAGIGYSTAANNPSDALARKDSGAQQGYPAGIKEMVYESMDRDSDTNSSRWSSNRLNSSAIGSGSGFKIRHSNSYSLLYLYVASRLREMVWRQKVRH